MKPSLPPNGLVGELSRHFFLGRSSAHLPGRHAVFHEKEYREALSRIPANPGPEARAARGRLLRFLGEHKRAAADLDAAIKAAPGLASARAWRWELRSSLGPASDADINKAVALEPDEGWWRLWLALAKATAGDCESALLDAAAAAERLPRAGLPVAVEGLLLFMLLRHAEAIVALDKALRLDPAMEWAWRLRGMCKHETGDLEGCLADCAAAMRLDENAGLLFVMFGLHKVKTDTRRSIEISTRYIEKNPKDFWAYVFRADNRRSPEIGESLGALDDLRRAVELDPRHGWVWAYLSRCQVTLGDFRSAGDSLARAVALDPDCGWIQAWRGEYLRRVGDVRGALKSLDHALRLSPDYELTYAWRGSVHRLLGDPEAALRDLDIAIKLKPHTLDLCYFERMQTYRALGRVGEALEDIQRASALNPKYAWETEPKRFGHGLAELDAEIRRNPANALAYMWRGDIHMRLRDFARGERDLTRAIARKNCPHEALILRGRARCELGRWKPAFADFNAAIKRAPETTFAYAWRGRASMLQAKYEPAIADFERALDREKNSAWLLSWMGEAEFKLKRYAKADLSLTKALELHNRFADAFLWRGAARFRLGALEAASADLTKALAIKPGTSLARYYRGHAALKEGRAGDARADFVKAVAEPVGLSRVQVKELRALLRRVHPSRAASGVPLLETAKGLRKEGRHEDAAKIYTSLLTERRDDVELYRLRADAHRCMGRYDLALRDLDAVVERLPGSADALSGRIEIKRHLWDFEGGLRDAHEALKLDPKSAPAWVLRSECERSLGRYDEAIESASTAIACDSAWNWALIVRAKARRQKGDLEGALADTHEAEKAGADGYARGWRAEILRKAGRLEESFQDIVAAVTMQPSNAWFLALRGQIRIELGDREKGLADLLEAMRLDPHCSCDYDFMGSRGPLVLQDAALGWVFAWRGGVRRAAEDLPAARVDLDHALSLAPDCFWILAWHGEILLRMGDATGGLAELRRALKLYPHYPQAWVWAGQALLKEEKLAAARKAFRSALAIEPNNVWGLIGEAVCLEKTGKAKEATALFARAHAINPALFAK